MIDLGESEKITAVLKLVLIFFTMVRSDLDFLVNIFGSMLTVFLTPTFTIFCSRAPVKKLKLFNFKCTSNSSHRL